MYRADIDGLRALAVVAVIIYHLDKLILPGGYLGVDVFFVISGYVVTLSLMRNGHEKFIPYLLYFYELRVKRILPALFFCLVVSGAFAAFFHPDPRRYILTGIWAVFGLSNFNFIKNSMDYEGVSAASNIFTHTWSLAIEEQFYLIFPAILWFLKSRLSSDVNLIIGILVISILSVLAYILFYNSFPIYSFYLMPIRFWEIATGSVCALIELKLKEPKKNNAISVFAFFCLLGFLVFNPLESQYSRLAVVPMVGAIILFVAKNTALYSLLSYRYMAKIGLLSFSLYLWHWPVIVISNWTLGTFTHSIFLVIAITIAFSILSYKYVETPLRHIQWGRSAQVSLARAGMASVTAAVLLQLLIDPLHGAFFLGERAKLEGRGVSSLTSIFSSNVGTWQGKKCVLTNNSDVGKLIRVEDCTLGNFETAKKRVLVVGNSFSAAFVQAFERLVIEKDASVTITSSWGASVVSEIPNTTSWDKANEYYWKNVIPSITSGLKPGDVLFLLNDMSEFSTVEFTSEASRNLELLELGLRKLEENLRNQGIRLLILHGLPLAREAKCTPDESIKQWFSLKTPPCKMPNRTDTLERRRYLDALLTDLSRDGILNFVDIFDVFCRGGGSVIIDLQTDLSFTEMNILIHRSKQLVFLRQDSWTPLLSRGSEA